MYCTSDALQSQSLHLYVDQGLWQKGKKKHTLHRQFSLSSHLWNGENQVHHNVLFISLRVAWSVPLHHLDKCLNENTLFTEPEEKGKQSSLLSLGVFSWPLGVKLNSFPNQTLELNVIIFTRYCCGGWKPDYVFRVIKSDMSLFCVKAERWQQILGQTQCWVIFIGGPLRWFHSGCSDSLTVKCFFVVLFCSFYASDLIFMLREHATAHRAHSAQSNLQGTSCCDAVDGCVWRVRILLTIKACCCYLIWPLHKAGAEVELER